MSGTFTTVRNGVESLSWQFPSSSQIHIVEMRHLQHVTLYPLASDIPTVVIVVYDPADRHSMERVADLLNQDRCTWLPQGCPLALARSGGSSDPPRPVRRLQERAKKDMSVVQMFDVLKPESKMDLLQWTLVVAATQRVLCPDLADHEKSVFEMDQPGFWSKLRHTSRRAMLLRKVTSKITLRSATDSAGTLESETQSTLLKRPDENLDSRTRPSTAPHIRQ